MKRHLIMIILPILLAFVAGILAAKANACDPGNWYDVSHSVCAPYPPANSPGYLQPPVNSPPPPGTPGWGR
jgi:hypothetical protein